MNIRFYVPVFAFTLFLSATLLFSVQPMFSKMVLPMLGGTPQVWNTAMLFFQATLLAGYAYAHGTSKFLSIKAQACVHIVLLFICLVFLPLAIPEGSSPPTDSDPTLWQLSLMAMCIGGPFFVVAANAPMFQRWFASTPHPDADNPYFLYGASNFGSMASLLCYPFLIEPIMGLTGQSDAWSFGYYGLILFTIVSVALVIIGNKSTDTNKANSNAPLKQQLSWKLRATWLFWAFIPSSMMLGVTTYITTDIASAPLLWIAPLALYVGSFIIVFARRELISNKTLNFLVFAGLMAVLGLSILFKNMLFNPFLIIGIHFSFFFVVAVACHKRLADLKPDASNLTEFYLLMSVGGVLGGFFNAIIAPQFFTSAIEYYFVICLACFVRYSWSENQSFRNSIENFKTYLKQGLKTFFTTEKNLYPFFIIGAGILLISYDNLLLNLILGIIIMVMMIEYYDKRFLFAGFYIFLLTLFPPASSKIIMQTDILHQERNFFGVIRVIDTEDNLRILMHGTTNHGVQSLDKEHKLHPISYYGGNSPSKELMDIYGEIPGPQNIAIAGLGSGVTACFQKEGRHFDFFEIDPSIVEIAQNPDYFTFLSDCGSDHRVILGDARLTIADQPDNKYDLIFMDAFSSDSVPIHLLTKEAIELYLEKLKPDGTILFHISNRHLDLEPILSAAAKSVGIKSLADISIGGKIDDTDLEYYPTHFVAFTNNPNRIDALRGKGWVDTIDRPDVKLWTDQYSNILSVFGSQTVKGRFDAAIKAKEAKEDADAKDIQEKVNEKSGFRD
ncbi:MAG: fused MFS/spermidine synthase [Bdellovibrionales bacterium]